MKVNVTVSDDLYEKYVRKFGVPNCFARMRAAIECFQDVDPNDRYLFLAGDDRRAVEAILGTTADDGQKLARLIKNMATVKIGGIEHSFTAEELARIDAQAGFHGRDRETYIKETVAELVGIMLGRV